MPIVILLMTGCITTQPPLPFSSEQSPPVYPGYRIGCPDVLDIRFESHPSWNALVSVDIDGTLPLSDAGRPNVHGLTEDQAREEIARVANIAVEDVSLRVVEPRSAKILISGPENGRRRTLPYRGPVSPLVLMADIGATTTETNWNAIYVLRPTLQEAKPAEKLPVNVLAQDLALHPSDHLIIGESRLASFCRLLPRWLQPSYRRLVGLPIRE